MSCASWHQQAELRGCIIAALDSAGQQWITQGLVLFGHQPLLCVGTPACVGTLPEQDALVEIPFDMTIAALH